MNPSVHLVIYTFYTVVSTYIFVCFVIKIKYFMRLSLILSDILGFGTPQRCSIVESNYKRQLQIYTSVSRMKIKTSCIKF